MNRVAFVRSNGLINHSFVADNPNTYSAGEVVDGLTVQFYPYTENPETWHSTRFWNFNTETWGTLPENPNTAYYVWDLDNERYSLDKTAFETRTRAERNKLLAKTDWCVLPDSPLSESAKTAAETYRQELRDFPSTINFATVQDPTLTWPTKPTFL